MFSPGSSKDGTFNLGSPLETKGFTPTAIFKFATNISRMDRIVRNTGVAVGRTCAAENSVPHKKKGSGQFMHISNKNTEYSRYENFDLTRMFNKQSFCDSNIPNSHG